MAEVFDVRIGTSEKHWPFDSIYRLQVDAIPRENRNEPIKFRPERIPLTLNLQGINKIQITAEFSGESSVIQNSALYFVTPIKDQISNEMKNTLADDDEWILDTQSWKEGSTASLTLVSLSENTLSTISLDLWINVNGLSEEISVDIYTDVLDSNSLHKPDKKTLTFCRNDGRLLPTHTGKTHFSSMHEQFSKIGVYRDMGDQASIHPKQTFTSHILESTINLLSQEEGKKLTIAYIGLDSGENFFSVNRCLRKHNNIELVCLVTHQEWDHMYQQLLSKEIESMRLAAEHDIVIITTDDLSDREVIPDFDIIIATYVASWANVTIKQSLSKLMNEKTILISVEPKQPEYVARSIGSLDTHNIREVYRSLTPPKLYEVDLAERIFLSSEYIQWSAWSKDSDWEIEAKTDSKGIEENFNRNHSREGTSIARANYISTMLTEGSLIQCAGYNVDCRKLYHAGIERPTFNETARVINIDSDGKRSENTFSSLPYVSFGMIGGAGVGKSIRFRQLFIERLELIQQNRYNVIPLFIESRNLNEIIYEYLDRAESFEYSKFGLDGTSYYEEVVVPGKFEDFSYDTVIEMLAKSAIQSTHGLKSIIDHNQLVSLMAQNSIELFIDGLDEVPTLIADCIESICKGEFYSGVKDKIHLPENFTLYLAYLEGLEQIYELIDGWGDEGEFEIDERKKLDLLLSEIIASLDHISQSELDWEFAELKLKNEVKEQVASQFEAFQEYLNSLIPSKKITVSIALSGRPSVEKKINSILNTAQQKLVPIPYVREIIHMSAINFGENIHIKIIEGIIRALGMNTEPIKSLMEEIVNENHNAWNDPFRIGWLVYFLCLGKTKEEISNKTSTLSFEKLLIEQLIQDSIKNSVVFEDTNHDLAKSFFDIVSTIACILHPSIVKKSQKTLKDVKEYIRHIYPKWKENTAQNITIYQFEEFVLFQIPVYITTDSTILWTHQRILDAAAALHMEGQLKQKNDYSFFDWLNPVPGLFDIEMLRSPQVILDRISIRGKGVNSEEALFTLLEYIKKEDFTLNHLRFLDIQIKKFTAKEHEFMGINPENDSLVFSGISELPYRFDAPMGEIKVKYLSMSPSKISKEIQAIDDFWTYLSAGGSISYLKLNDDDWQKLQLNAVKIIELHHGNPRLALEHFIETNDTASQILDWIPIVPSERYMYSPFMGEIILSGFSWRHHEFKMLCTTAVQAYFNRIDNFQMKKFREIYAHTSPEVNEKSISVELKSTLLSDLDQKFERQNSIYERQNSIYDGILREAMTSNMSGLIQRNRVFNNWLAAKSNIKYSTASVFANDKNEYWVEDSKGFESDYDFEYVMDETTANDQDLNEY